MKGSRLLLGLAAVVASMTFGAQAAQADVVFPTNANDFTGGTQGWSGAENACSILNLPIAPLLPIPIVGLCSVENAHAPNEGVGDPKGSLRARFSAPLNGLAAIPTPGPLLFEGRSRFVSPSFTAPATVNGATYEFARRTSVEGLVNVGGEAATRFVLVNETPNPDVETQLLADPITASETTFVRRAGIVPAGQLIPGNRYHVELRTTFRQTLLQLINGNNDAFYDNVRITVADGTDNGTVAPAVVTLNPSDLTDTSATLNGSFNPKGLASTGLFNTNTGALFDLGDLGNGIVPVVRSTAFTGLTKCTRYGYQAFGTNAIGTTPGGVVEFSTDCQPTARTLPVAPISATTAVFNSSIVPNGPETSYVYELTRDPNVAGVRTDTFVAGSGRDVKQANSVPASGLAPSTRYFVRVIASNRLGETVGEYVEFTTPPQSAPGPAGATGTAGPAGRPGTPAGSGSGTSGSGASGTLSNSDARALLTIRSNIVRIGIAGRRRGQIRLPIFCKQLAGRTCAGTVKIRTRGKINPSTTGARKTPRRVTLATFEYQLAQNRRGFAINTIQPEKVDLVRRLRNVRVTISVQVTGAANNRQTVVRNGTMVARRTI